MYPSGTKVPAPNGRTLLEQHALGAAHAVTGSLFLYQYFYDGKVTRWLLDCGSTVEDPRADFLKRLPQGITAAGIDFIIISHGHADHCGYLPKLIKDGFKGKVFVTPATKDLMSIILPDSGHLQKEAAKRLLKRFLKGRKDVVETYANAGNSAKRGKFGKAGKGKGKQKIGRDTRADIEERLKSRFAPLYTEADAALAMKSLVTVDYHVRRRVSPEIAFTFTDAGHILGSAVVNMEIGVGAEKRTLCFTGNIGRPNMPLLRDLEPVAAADYVMLEATYGNKLHLRRDRLTALAAILNAAYKRAKRHDPQHKCGVILVPSFAVGRGQTFLNDVRLLIEAGRLPNMPVFADGNMLNAATEIYKKHAKDMNAETRKLLEAGKDPYAAPRHKVVREWQESEALHIGRNEPIMIVASSGMAQGGRIMGHLLHWLPGKQNTVLFIGHQGEGTLGETLTSTIPTDAEGKPNPNYRNLREVKIKHDRVRIGAKIELMPDYSAHADYEDQITWLRKLKRQPKRIFIVHGDLEGLEGFKGHIEKALGWRNVTIPAPKQVHKL